MYAPAQPPHRLMPLHPPPHTRAMLYTLSPVAEGSIMPPHIPHGPMHSGELDAASGPIKCPCRHSGVSVATP